VLGPRPASAQPTWWISAGGHGTVETGVLGEFLSPEAGAFAGAGFHLWRFGPFLVGADAEASAGRASADIGPADDTINIYRGRAGVRTTWWIEHEEPRLVPYGRAGAVYRVDRGRGISDDGFGWYAGVGLDVRLSEVWSFGPFLAYEVVSLSVETGTFVFAFALSLGF
jgi:hypothetical protein